MSVIIPAYNEEKRLPKTLTDIGGYLGTQDYPSEIIVVDGGSTDRTSDIVREFSVKLIEVKNCQGKGRAVKEGMSAARGKFRIFTDADNSTSINQAKKMLPYFAQGYDVIIGSRDIKGAVLDPPQPFLRKIILGKGFRLLRKFIIGLWGIQDTQCGFKCFSERASRDIFSKIKIMGFSFDAEALVIAKKLGYKIKEVPVHWRNDLESKVKFKGILNMASDLLKIKWNLITGKYEK